MDKENIDASAGLAFSLTLFERYRRTGLLQANLPRVPRMRGHYRGNIQLIEGKVISSYLEDSYGQRYPISKEQLIRLDNEKGPYEWTLTPLIEPPKWQAGASILSESGEIVPRRITELNMDRLQGWTGIQKMMLMMVFEAINGEYTIQEIKTIVPLAPTVIEEGLRILLSLKVISMVQPEK